MLSVHVLILGGTITMVQKSGGLRPARSEDPIRELLSNTLPEVDFSVRTILQVASPSITKVDMLALRDEIALLLADSRVCSVIVVQGTDTIEETAFLLDLSFRSSKPIIVTGAMRGADAIGADGPANIVAAGRVAIDPRSKDRGCVVVLNDEIHLACDVRKRHTSSVAAFASPNMGLAGAIVEDRVRYFSQPYHRDSPALTPVRIPDVALHSVGIWDDGRDLLRLAAMGYKGLVIQGVGAGHVPQAMVDPISEVAQVMPIILCSRAAEGMVHTQTYAYPGAEVDLISRGIVSAGYLCAPKARVLLALLLGVDAQPVALKTAFKAFQMLA